MDSQRKNMILSIAIFLSSLLLLSSPCQAVKSLSPSPFPNSPRIPPLVKELCGKTADSEPFCIKTFASDNRIWKAKNFVELTAIFLSLGTKHAEITEKFISGLAEKKGMINPESKKALENCANNFHSIYNNFASALMEVEDGDYEGEGYDTANYDIMVSMDGIKMCREHLFDAKLSIKDILAAIDATNYFINIGATFTNII